MMSIVDDVKILLHLLNDLIGGHDQLAPESCEFEGISQRMVEILIIISNLADELFPLIRQRDRAANDPIMVGVFVIFSQR